MVGLENAEFSNWNEGHNVGEGQEQPMEKFEYQP